MRIRKKDDTVSRCTNQPRDDTTVTACGTVVPPGNRPREPSVWRELGRLGIKIAIFAVTVILVFTFAYGFHRNIEPGMLPMVKDGDLVMFYRLDKNYGINDLILLEFQGGRQIRRVVAKSGDTVDITEDGLIVNGSLVQEHEIYEETSVYVQGIDYPVTVGTDEVFVLGDARCNATDSRIYGLVKTNHTLGKVITVIRRRNL